jgi:hypothetical protein
MPSAWRRRGRAVLTRLDADGRPLAGTVMRRPGRFGQGRSGAGPVQRVGVGHEITGAVRTWLLLGLIWTRL